MTPVHIPVEERTPAWYETRRQGVTASEIPVILGLSPWSSPFNLYWEKLGEIDPQADTETLAWGRDLEAAILGRFARQHPELGVTRGGLFHHADDPRRMATPDALAHPRRRPADNPTVRRLGTYRSRPSAVVQVKTAADPHEWGEEGTDQIPAHYLAQVRWEMHVMGVRAAHVPVLFSGRTYREYVVHQDDNDVALMVKAAGEFLDRIEAGDPPDIDAHPATTRTLQQIHPERGEGEIEVPGTWVRQWQLADRLEQAAAQRKALAENRLRALIGDHHAATVNGQPVANKVVYNQRRVDSQALKAAGVYDRYARTSTVHKLLVTRPKKEKAAK